MSANEASLDNWINEAIATAVTGTPDVAEPGGQ